MIDKSQATLWDGWKSKEKQWKAGSWQVPNKGVPHPAPRVTVPSVHLLSAPNPPSLPWLRYWNIRPLSAGWILALSAEGTERGCSLSFWFQWCSCLALVRQHSMVTAQVVLTLSQIQWYQPCKQISEEFHRIAPTSGTSPGPTEGSSQHIILTAAFQQVQSTESQNISLAFPVRSEPHPKIGCPLSFFFPFLGVLL